MNKFNRLLVAFVWLSAASVSAETISIEGSNKRTGIDIQLSPDMAGKKIAVHVQSPGAELQTLDLSVDGPNGTKITAKGTTVSGKDSIAAIYASGGATALTLYPLSNSRATQAVTISTGTEPSSSPPIMGSGNGDPNCGCLPVSTIQLLSQFNPNFCRQFPPVPSCTSQGGGTTAPAGAGVSAKAFVSINKCLGSGRPGVTVELDLAGVAAQDLTGIIHVTTIFHEWDGNKRASIKPTSDGKYGPVPLLLAGPVYGGSDKPQAKLLVHKGKRVTRSKVIKINDNIYYRGNSYWRIVLNGVLNGGKGTFELTSGGEGYSICAKLVRSRQRFNGYSN